MTGTAYRHTRDDDPRWQGYHGRPVLKPPAWTWEVPWYLFVGGTAGASSLFAAAAQAAGQPELARRARLVAVAGAVLSPPLLIADLGRPARFLHMLRVFKPTSVMSMGSWILTAYGGAATGAAGLRELDRLRPLHPVTDAVAAALGVGMATYTGALVADTAIPAWHEARRELPALFAGSAAAGAGAAGVLLSPVHQATPARRLTLLGAGAELVVDQAMLRRLGPLGQVYKQGPAGRFHRAAQVLTAAGAATVALAGRRSRIAACAGAIAVLAGSVCQRWAVYKAGFQSAADPEATLRPQRERRAARSAGM